MAGQFIWWTQPGQKVAKQEGQEQPFLSVTASSCAVQALYSLPCGFSVLPALPDIINRGARQE